LLLKTPCLVFFCIATHTKYIDNSTALKCNVFTITKEVKTIGYSESSNYLDRANKNGIF